MTTPVPGSPPIRIAVLDDNERFRAQLIERLRFFPAIQMVFDAGTPEEFFWRLDREPNPPDVVLLDIGLPRISGVEVARRLAAEPNGMGILMLTVFEEPDTVLAAIQAGAAGYLLKDATADRIVRAIEEVAEGGVPLSRPIARKLLGLLERLPAPAGTDRATEPEEALSPREVELLECIVQGDTEAEIADRLGISPHTVRTHVKNIYRKLHVGSRAAVVRLAFERRLLEQPNPPRSNSNS